jgi:hypothetical protein
MWVVGSISDEVVQLTDLNSLGYLGYYYLMDKYNKEEYTGLIAICSMKFAR